MALNDEEEAALRGQLTAAHRELGDTQKALKDVNKESQGHRLNADRANDAANAAKAALDEARAKGITDAEALRIDLTAKATAAEEKAAKAKVDADHRTVGAELRAAGVMAGMRDPDLVKLLDASTVTMGEDGKVVIPPKLFEDAKAARPYLFGIATANTASTAAAPTSDAASAPAKFGDMTPDQQAQWKRQTGIR